MSESPTVTELGSIYARRFTPDLAFRREMWKILCEDFFQKYIPLNSTVLELAAGYCEFINQIKCGAKLALDINPDTPRHANPDVRVIPCTSTNIVGIEPKSVDVAFCSNFLEHLTRQEILGTIRETRRLLKLQGRFVILQPNIRFCQKDYWMFFDHLTPLDDRSVVEALETNGFRVTEVIPRFLPYTTKSRLPKSTLLMKWYIRFRPLWSIFGAQAVIVATPDPDFAQGVE